MSRLAINKEVILEKLRKLNEARTGKTNNSGGMSKDYSLIKDIRGKKLYKDNVTRRNTKSRRLLENSIKNTSSNSIQPGSLIMFDYFEPKTKEELEYYDARPVTVFFNMFMTEQGKRVIGFNIHYYPPRIRWIIMGKIIEMFRSYYSESWDKIEKKRIPGFNYDVFMKQLESRGLAFGVRMYDPGLMYNIKPIPTKNWADAALTEGVFRKRTREQILHYWSNEFGKKLKKKESKQKKS